ncbi:chorismate mutase [Pseudoalteromonas sp. MMG013]|uniref:chorismate mutase n=1 Tax=unclassified Pseudoalteromonas TaxID=194690 RepID=UPI001B369136|nr:MULTISPECIES: chorismate mutase [unclassified Pseudoalteromonas]MBQ4848234.1 chorismate mutase [Pseudoalteromonas sp. MMG005]MBQ4860088.1 chorismate mutase [Pseudoalteromonas sp. MMG013]
MLKFIVLLMVVMSLPAWSISCTTETFNTINKRLSYMQDIALYKANNHLAIEDIARENIVITASSNSAAKIGLDKESVKAFFIAQISAAKAVQYRYRADLLSNKTSHKPRDLNTIIRPQLIELGSKINTQIAYCLKHGQPFTADQETGFINALTVDYLSNSDKKKLFNALINIRLQPIKSH